MPGAQRHNMEVDVGDILREVIAFLERLRDEQLPLALESLRERLLERSKSTLSVATMARSSPEPYLDMNAGLKSVLLTKSETDSEDYVGMESSPQQAHQDYYETFEHQTVSATSALVERHGQRDIEKREENEALMRIYKSLSVAQSRAKCHKCGSVYRKEGKKLFLSESRACWIALVGSHLLIYRSERHNRPYAVYPIRGYLARAAPNLLPRDPQRSESAFEMYCPGSETLQFIGRTPKDMDQWITKICEVGCSDESTENGIGTGCEKERPGHTIGSPTGARQQNGTRRQEGAVKARVIGESTTKTETRGDKNEAELRRRERNAIENPPPLPARIPRRLPSLPPDDFILAYEAAVAEDDDDDDIYHKIEDLKNSTPYQNMVLSKKKQRAKRDDAGACDVALKARGGKGQEEKPDDATSHEEMYDDIVSLTRVKDAAAEEERRRNDARPAGDAEENEISYDEVENLMPNGRSAKDRAKDQTDTSNRFPQKKSSFLDRVWSRRENLSLSPGKLDKRSRGKVSSSPPSSAAAAELPTYDDVSELTASREPLANGGEEELPEYNCPPPPRPICANGSNQAEEIYDDVSVCREQYKSHQQTIRDSCVRMKEAKSDATEQSVNDNPAVEEMEHYQSPRSDLRVGNAPEAEKEELYDDIALWADFTARQREAAGRKDSSEDAKASGSDKRSRNLFAISRILRSGDGACSAEAADRRSGNECEEVEDSAESNNGSIRRNTFQKLISKMENSLARVAARNPSTFPTSKLNAASNNL